MKYALRDCNKNGIDDDRDIDEHIEDDVDGNLIPDTCDPPGNLAKYIGPADSPAPDSSMLIVRYAPPDLIVFRFFVPQPSRVQFSIRQMLESKVLFERDYDRGWQEWPWTPVLQGRTYAAQGKCSVVAVIGQSRHNRVVAWSYSKN